MTSRRHQGAVHEQDVAAYLADKGWVIHACNYHSRYGEIDIIAEENGVFVFVEVKARTRAADFEDFPPIPRSKVRKMVKTALHFLTSREMDFPEMRFDVVFVSQGKIAHYENAIEVSEDDYEI